MPRRNSSLLINESPLQTLPSLAAIVGINGAIILQQIKYYLNSSEHIIDGHTWIYNSYDKWAEQFKWLKPRAIQKHILALEKEGYLVARQFKYKTKNNTKWYRIDYDRLEEAVRDREDIHSLLPKGNGECEDSNGGDTFISHETKLNLEQNTHKNTQYNIIDIWTNTLNNLKSHVNKANFKTWLAETVPLSFDDGTFVIGVKNEFVREYLMNNQKSLIENELTRALDKPIKIICTVKVK